MVHDPLGDLGFAEALEGPGRAAAPRRRRRAGSVARRAMARQGARVARRDQQGLAAVAGDLAAAADVGQDQGLAHGRGLDGRAGHALTPGGEHEHVHHRQQVADVVAPAGDQHVPGGPDQLGLGDGVGLLEVGGADGQEPDPRVGPADGPGGANSSR